VAGFVSVLKLCRPDVSQLRRATVADESTKLATMVSRNSVFNRQY